MWRIRYRNWRRRNWSVEIQASRNERMYLERQPWLRQLVPLWRLIWSDCIKVYMADLYLLSHTARHDGRRSRGMFLVDGGGNILTEVRRRLWLWDETVYQALVRLGDAANEVKFVVKVYGNEVGCGMEISRFPAKEPTMTFVNRLLDEEEQRIKVAREERRREEQARIERETETERQEVEAAFPDNTEVAKTDT